MNLVELFQNTDAVGKAVALLLLAMSILSWLLIFWKAILFTGSRKKLNHAIAAFWAAQDWDAAQVRVQALDKRKWLLPLVQAAQAASQQADASGFDGQSSLEERATRLIRQSLSTVTEQIQMGQTALATIGATAPFVGLLGTVWGIYHALASIGEGGVISMDKISAPVGEALIMTAIGLAVAIPAVLAYNFFARLANRSEAQLEGFAHDLRAFVARPAAAGPASH